VYRARLKLPADFEETDLEILGQALEDVSLGHIALREENLQAAPWKLEWIIQDKPSSTDDFNARLHLTANLNNIDLPRPEWQFEEIPDIDWLAHSYQQFPPFSVGPFFIYGSHFTSGVPDGQIGLQIDAATAFGSGEHGTTKGCLQAMLDLKGIGQCPWNVLDMGTGSGILAVAAWRLWKTPVLAIDNDAESVRVAAHHVAINQITADPSSVTCDFGDGFKTKIVQQKKPYDLIIANILAGPLIDMAQELAEVTDENGYVILSGMLNDQAADVLKAYETQGFALKKRYDIGEWSSLAIQKQ
jgi:ribosomal protein L11 methyltransferase